MTELMQMVIDELGVKIGERFKLRDMNNHISPSEYYFNDVGKLDSLEDVHKCNLEGFFLGLFTGDYTIVKLPFKPVSRESYQFVSWDGDVYTTQWRGTLQDYYCFNAKNCFRPEEKITEEDKKRIVAEMKKEYDGQ